MRPAVAVGAHLKVVALVAFALGVVATPATVVWPYLVDAVALAALAVAVRAPLGRYARWLLLELPFWAFALLLPFVATGPRVAVGPLELSEAGLWGGWALLARGTLGLGAALLLAATTDPFDLLAGLRRLRVPALLVEIAGLMLRYVDVVADQWRRMGVARASRGFDARSPAAWPALGTAVGTLFVHSYERGERVHLAMLSRGYAGKLPVLRAAPAASAPAVAGLFAAPALAIALAAVAA